MTSCPIHLGNRTGYSRHGCRCKECTDANNAYMIGYRTKHPEKHRDRREYMKDYNKNRRKKNG